MKAKWKTFETPPASNLRVIVIFYWPDEDDYNMTLQAWNGWDVAYMESNGWGEGTYPVLWMEAPSYPENIPNVNGEKIH